MKRSWIWKGMLICSLIWLPGCGFKDIDRRFFVMAIGIDKSEHAAKPYRVSLKLAIPFSKIQPGQTNDFQLISDDAGSIAEAVRHMKSKVDKELDFSQAKIIVIGKPMSAEILRKGTLDWFLRRRDIQGSAFMALGDPTAEDILNVKTSSERFPGDSLFLSFDQDGTESSYILTEYLYDFHRRATEKGIDPYLPVIRPRDNGFLIDRVAVFDKKELKAVLSPGESRVFNELTKHFQKFDLETKNDAVQFAINVHKATYRYRIDASKPAMPKLTMNIRMIGQSEESTESLYKKPWSYYERLAEQQAQARYTKLLEKMQSLEVDPVGFGLYYRATRNRRDQDWTSWQAIYPNLSFQTNVKIVIKSSGGVK
ncbi:Ger(x)C family spore germination protein [Paenibacillus rhizovicinus]|uniref:Ger(X)C family spore germination protein n=1 Tax=Paenibacillus rhizovicinus TaxID=2704463 RepID=A0A6C0NTW9_9BACL|nr:Ger(x)C family spore germination protein [Paenibacillus rhizovicinus]QHW29608.1 Ger(x)C family spore germination protein [Paenibacillus rhizovicinus]